MNLVIGFFSWMGANGSTVEVSIDGGANWSNIFTVVASSGSESLALTAYAGQSVMIGFRYQGVNAHSWTVSNISVSYSDLICS